MNKPSIPSSKICSVCGLEKPLSAFLLRSGLLGATYSNICNTCREAGGKPRKEHDDETRRDVGGSKIRSSERVAAERKKRELLKEKEELKEEEKEKEVTVETQKTAKKENALRTDKMRRNFLDNIQRVLGAEATKTADTSRQTESVAVRAEKEQAKQRYEQAKKQESDIDVTSPHVRLEQEKYKGALFQAVRDRLTLGLGKQADKQPAASETLPAVVKRTWPKK